MKKTMMVVLVGVALTGCAAAAEDQGKTRTSGSQGLAVPTGGPVVLKNEWPNYLGPNGNFSESSGVKLLDDPSKARLVWISEERQIGGGKYGMYIANGERDYDTLPPGGVASPIVSDGLVIMSYFIPSGDVLDATCQKNAETNPRVLLDAVRIAADDVVLAVDAATGKTKWKQVFAGKGLNLATWKRHGWGMTPVADKGRLFSVGTTGRLYAMELATGKLLWESNIGPKHDELEKLKAKSLNDRVMPQRVASFLGGLLVVDDVVLIPCSDGPLVGVDPSNGKVLWQTKQTVMGLNLPAPVVIGGKSYVVTADGAGKLRLIRPKTGEVLWTKEQGCIHITQPLFGSHFLLAYEQNPSVKDASDPRTRRNSGVLAAYRIDESGAQRAWILPAETSMGMGLDGGAGPRVSARDGLVYYLWCSVTRPEGLRGRMIVVREKDGEILVNRDLLEREQVLSGPYLIGDRWMLEESTGLGPGTHFFHTADPADSRFLGSFNPGKFVTDNPVKPRAGVKATIGYEFMLRDAFVDGFLFVRVSNGHIVCWDLRKEK